MANASLYCRNGSKSESIVHLPLAKFEHWLRKAAQRTTEAVYNTIAPILEPSLQSSALITSQTPSTTKPKPITLASGKSAAFGVHILYRNGPRFRIKLRTLMRLKYRYSYYYDKRSDKGSANPTPIDKCPSEHPDSTIPGVSRSRRRCVNGQSSKGKNSAVIGRLLHGARQRSNSGSCRTAFDSPDNATRPRSRT